MSFKIESIKFLDNLIGNVGIFFSKRIVTPRTVISSAVEKILVIRPGGIGDAVLLFPALKKLQSYYPDAQVDILAEKRNSEVFNFCPYISEVFLYDTLSENNILNIYKKNYDIVVDTEQWHKLSSVVAYCTRAPKRIGFATNKRESLFNITVQYEHSDYEAICFLKLVNQETGGTLNFDSNKSFIDLNEELRVKYKNELASYSKNYKGVVGLFSGATVNERRWGIRNYAQLSSMLIDSGYGIILVGGSSDLHDIETLMRIVDINHVRSYVGKTSLEETAAIISILDLFISADSGLMHIAYGVGAKTLSLFGAGIEEKWAPKGYNNCIVNKNLTCSPCTKFGYTPSCPYNVKCLSEISVNEVFEKATELLKH